VANAQPRAAGLLALAWHPQGETFARLVAGFAVGVAAAWRYVDETVALLAARAPGLCKGGPGREEGQARQGDPEGTLIPVERVAADRPFYSGKSKKHGMNLQVIDSPCGEHPWVPGSLPRSVHDETSD
jgi:hypothetical protein